MCRAPAALALFVAATVAHTAARGAEPILPTPPHQSQPWTPPPTSLPRFLVSATASLCEQGLADPRGCEYRKIKLALGGVWGGQGNQVETTGWVLPTGVGGKPQYAVAWSGLVYPLAGDLGPGDLDADIRALVGATDAVPKDQLGRTGGFDGSRATNELSSNDAKIFYPIKVCLLLRRGRADLAESLWAAAHGKRAARPNGAGKTLDLNSYGVSYLTLARDLAWYHFDRALRAHMQGDDRIALADARFLLGFTRAVEIKADAMGFERPEPMGGHGEPAPYIQFLGQLPELLSDQERRAWERAKPPAPPRGEGREAKVAALIRALDQVAVRQWSQPGGVVLGESPIIQELIAQGDAAVEPLIRAFRTEDRLTRSVGFHRDFVRSRTILRADQAEYTALTGILKVANFAPPAADGPNGPRTRDQVADEIQAYWEKNRAIPLVERWYRALADGTNQNLAVSIARFTLARDKAGDADAIREYAEWLRTTSPGWLDHNALAVLEPLLRKRDDPTLAAAAAWLFGDPQSPWRRPIGRKGAPSNHHLMELIASPMVDFPAFRAMLLAALDDRSPIGRAEFKDGTVSVRMDDGFSIGSSTPHGDSDPPARGAIEALRTCDFYAWRLSTLQDAPAFNPCWPLARRDDALSALAAFLKRKGAK